VNARLRPLGIGLLLVASCGWNPSRPFDREAPAVKEALVELDGGDAGSAVAKLEDYLSTGACKDGNIGTPDLLKRRTDGTFDLGLSLFRIGERYGRRFGEEEIDSGVDEGTRSQRHEQVECARRVVDAIADDPAISAEARARAHYLDGNLAFLDGDYESAVKAYDRALILAPGEVDAADSLGRDAAWNRAIALRRIEDRKDAGSDASQDSGQPDGSGDAARPDGSGGDSGSEAGGDSGGSTPDAGSNDKQDAGQDSGQPPSEPPDASPESKDAAAQPPPQSRDEDERMLDQLESAPTLQQEEAKRMGKKRVRGMADK
jgi:hypothetical protein